MRILIVEDNPKVSDGIRQLLRDKGYAIDCVEDGEAAISAVLALNYDLVILDLGLPDMDGLDALAEIRANRIVVPVLVLTARGGLEDRIKGLDLGADDYLSKPFEPSELEARVRALLRRRSAIKTARLEFSGVSMDIKTGEVRSGGSLIKLPNRELNVLREFMVADGKMLSKTKLMDSLGSFDDDISENALEQVISRLRRRLTKYGLTISMARGLGYYLKSEDR